eukprot:TRINITY_DN2220_c0_g1_i3.p1 TRINITY_DN2220_c0_g1~~TRINITY_DN2220_c0_g1_i3.p1  ORF type:complete len:227 (+),score=30.16 TRINITY_DN2220_c0_g1_i3:570-1250(+)
MCVYAEVLMDVSLPKTTFVCNEEFPLTLKVRASPGPIVISDVKCRLRAKMVTAEKRFKDKMKIYGFSENPNRIPCEQTSDGAKVYNMKLRAPAMPTTHGTHFRVKCSIQCKVSAGSCTKPIVYKQNVRVFSLPIVGSMVSAAALSVPMNAMMPPPMMQMPVQMIPSLPTMLSHMSAQMYPQPHETIPQQHGMAPPPPLHSVPGPAISFPQPVGYAAGYDPITSSIH